MVSLQLVANYYTFDAGNNASATFYNCSVASNGAVVEFITAFNLLIFNAGFLAVNRRPNANYPVS